MALGRAFDLQDRICVVTGGGSGLGRAIALAFAREGARVAILDENVASAEQTLQQAGAAAGMALACDTASPASVEAARRGIEAQLGIPDILINNAGVIGAGSLADVSLDDWNRLLSADLTGYLILSQIFGRAMRARRAGAIVHIVSLAAEQTMTRIAGYGIAQAGATMLSRSLAAEWGPDGVRSNVVLPGLVDTPMAQARDGDVARGRAAAVPLGCVAQPADIAQAVLFLASPCAAYVNGAELRVDGGLAPNLMSLAPRFA